MRNTRTHSPVLLPFLSFCFVSAIAKNESLTYIYGALDIVLDATSHFYKTVCSSALRLWSQGLGPYVRNAFSASSGCPILSSNILGKLIIITGEMFCSLVQHGSTDRVSNIFDFKIRVHCNYVKNFFFIKLIKTCSWMWLERVPRRNLTLSRLFVCLFLIFRVFPFVPSTCFCFPHMCMFASYSKPHPLPPFSPPPNVY